MDNLFRRKNSSAQKTNGSPPSLLATNVFTNKDSPNSSISEAFSAVSIKSISPSPSQIQSVGSKKNNEENIVEVSMVTENESYQTQYFSESNNNSDDTSGIDIFDAGNFIEDDENDQQPNNNVNLEAILRNQIDTQQKYLMKCKALTLIIEICLILAVATAIVGVVISKEYLLIIPLVCSCICFLTLRIMTITMFLIAFSCSVILFVEGLYFTVLVLMIFITGSLGLYSKMERIGFILDCSQIIFASIELGCFVSMRNSFVKIQNITNPYAPPLGTSVPLIHAFCYPETASKTSDNLLNKKGESKLNKVNNNDENDEKNTSKNISKKLGLLQRSNDKNGETNNLNVTEVDVLQIEEIRMVITNNQTEIGEKTGKVPLDNIVLENTPLQNKQVCPRDKRKGVLRTPNFNGTHRGSHRTFVLPEALSDKYIVDNKRIFSPVGSTFIQSPSDRVATTNLKEDSSGF